MIPVQRPYLGREEVEAVAKVFDSRWLGMGSVVKQFEDRLAEFIGARHVLAVNTGTSALHIALDALGLGPDDEVIVPSLTFVASVQAILACGARPVFCDVSAKTLNMDVADVAKRITSRTRVLMPVHYGGLACDMDAILAMAEDHGVTVVEDAAHAFGSSYKGRFIGSFGHVTCFSFDPIKNITCGEGGAVVTNDGELASRMTQKRILGIDNDTWARYHGQRNWFYEVVTTGFRYHLSDIGAAIGLAQLNRFADFRSRKQLLVRQYDQLLQGIRGLEFIERDYDETFPFFYIVKVPTERRDELMAFLKQRGIGSGVHYIPNHLQPLFRHSCQELPVTSQVWQQILTLPLYYEMTDADQLAVADALKAFLVA